METGSRYGTGNHINENKRKGNTVFLWERLTKLSLIWVGVWSSFVSHGYYLRDRHKLKSQSFRQGKKPETGSPRGQRGSGAGRPGRLCRLCPRRVSSPNLSKPSAAWAEPRAALLWARGWTRGFRIVLWSYFSIEMSPELFQQASLVMSLQVFIRTQESSR